MTEPPHDSDATVAPAFKNTRRRAAAVLSSIALTMVLMSPVVSASELKGTVVNGTTNTPAAGDEVVLLSVSADGMNETARGNVDRRGHFSFSITDSSATHVVRVIHEGVTYHRILDTAAKPLVIKVYDAVATLEGVSAVMEVERLEASGDQLEVKQLITVRNSSQPPRTLVNDRPFEIQLPPEAQVQSGLVQVENTAPLKQTPIAGNAKGQYYFEFPIRPGDTRFAVVYRLPYNGEALMEPRIRNRRESFVVMLPKSMKFEPTSPEIFREMPGTTPDHVVGTGPLDLDQRVAFRISGRGKLEELEGRRQEARNSKADPQIRPGGGLGPPIEQPDPLQKYRLPILAGMTVLMVMGAAYVMTKNALPRTENSDRVERHVTGRMKKQLTVRRVDRPHRQHTRA